MTRHCPPASLEVASTHRMVDPASASTALLLRRVARSVLVAGIERLLLWHELARQRHQLHMMDDRMLKDIGLTRADVESETQKPFWRL
jgi:uncharacterized protein YjiS (DUF1127 family)